MKLATILHPLVTRQARREHEELFERSLEATRRHQEAGHDVAWVFHTPGSTEPDIQVRP